MQLAERDDRNQCLNFAPENLQGGEDQTDIFTLQMH